MFPVDSLPSHYYEEREAADAAKRLAHIHEQQMKAQAASVNAALKGQQRQPQPPKCLSQPAMSQPTSSTVLGNIFQGFVKTSNSPPSSCKGASSGATTPVATPPAKIMTQAEVERLMAEKRKDADYVGSSPGWW